MKLKLNFQTYKSVSFHNILLHVPADTKYLAADKDGRVWAYIDSEPRIYGGCGWSATGAFDAVYVATVEFVDSNQWDDSLEEYK